MMLPNPSAKDNSAGIAVSGDSSASNSASSPDAIPLGERLLWTVAEAAAMTSLSTRTIKRLAARGVLPGVLRIGGCVRIARRAVEDWIRDGCPRASATAKRRQRRAIG